MILTRKCWYTLLCSLALSSCASDEDPFAEDDEVEDETSTPEDTAPGDIQPRASSSDTMSSCIWETNSSTVSANASVSCDAGQKPIAGGCRSNASHGGSLTLLEKSHPFEGGSTTDIPDDGDFWYNLSGTSGWRCGFDAAPDTGTHYVWAVCCGT